MNGSKFAGLGLDVDTSRRMTVLHPVTNHPLKDESGANAYIDIYSADSRAAQGHRRQIQDQRLDAVLSRGSRVKSEAIDQEHIDLLVALTAGWHLVALDGSALDIPFSKDAATELYASPAMTWLRDQVDRFAADRANFLPASSTN